MYRWKRGLPNKFISKLYNKPLQLYIKQIKNKKKEKDTGKIFFQHIFINWSNLYLGSNALININKQAIITTLIFKKKTFKI